MISYKCSEETFSLIWDDGVECIAVVEVFKYLGRMLDQLNNNWPAFLRNIRKAQQVWGKTGR